MNWLIDRLVKMRLFPGDLDLHLVRASMVIIYFFFGYQKWFDYEAQGLIPFFTHGPLIFWMYPVFGMKVSTYFLGVSEWLFGALLLLGGFWNKKLGILGALGSVFTFLCTVTIIPFMPDGWAPSAGGFPAIVAPFRASSCTGSGYGLPVDIFPKRMFSRDFAHRKQGIERCRQNSSSWKSFVLFARSITITTGRRASACPHSNRRWTTCAETDNRAGSLCLREQFKGSSSGAGGFWAQMRSGRESGRTEQLGI